MTALDATGLFALEEVAKQPHASNRTLIPCGAREQPSRLIHQADSLKSLGKKTSVTMFKTLCAGLKKYMKGWRRSLSVRARSVKGDHVLVDGQLVRSNYDIEKGKAKKSENVKLHHLPERTWSAHSAVGPCGSRIASAGLDAEPASDHALF